MGHKSMEKGVGLFIAFNCKDRLQYRNDSWITLSCGCLYDPSM